ncbi:MAG: hypothetical protein AAF846_07950 [Chloroflexota bacterium]
MKITRQVEITALTFTQYDNGISEIKYSDGSERASEGFSRFLDMLLREAMPSDTIRLLIDLTKTGRRPLGHHYRYIDALNAKYDAEQLPRARFANLYSEITIQRRMVLEFMRSRELDGVELNIFPVDQRTRAVMWLLNDDNST